MHHPSFRYSSKANANVCRSAWDTVNKRPAVYWADNIEPWHSKCSNVCPGLRVNTANPASCDNPETTTKYICSTKDF